ncbi:MAG TPA: hypothetical protein VNI77_09435, partial [Nitrososphaera sp.]|nr:hypothetical protein [Nitrososphaera sp.]
FNSRSSRLAATNPWQPPKKKKRRSHVVIWKWIQKYADCADRYRTDRRLVRAIFVDETLL